jgi:hypothetical protein
MNKQRQIAPRAPQQTAMPQYGAGLKESAAPPLSFPAPAMPLTEQERLLIRLAHHDDPVQLAQLSTGRREVRYQQEKQQVSDFFMVFTPDATLMEPDGGTQ